MTVAHMEIQSPPPRRSPFNPTVAERDRDYNNMAPLLADGSNFPCKYPRGNVVATYSAGDTIKVEFHGDVFHEGGHCQFSISYNDRDFLVLEEALEHCFVATGKTFEVKLPEDTPACSQCTFAWSWVNAIGAREYYMNCVDIRITNKEPVEEQIIVGERMVVANLPNFPRIPEFPPATYKGLDLYASAPTISLDGSDSVIGNTTKTTTIIGTTTTKTTTPTTTTSQSTRTQTIDDDDSIRSWKVNIAYIKGNVVSFKGSIYVCLQNHFGYAHWAPDVAISLWSKVSRPVTTIPTTTTSVVPTSHNLVTVTVTEFLTIQEPCTVT